MLLIQYVTYSMATQISSLEFELPLYLYVY